MFPHHEDEIAQSEAANGCRFVNYWLHCAHLMVDGGKMSKSAGNFHTLRDIIDRGFTGREVRYVLLGAHYRQSLNFSFRACEDARASLQRLDDFVQRVREVERSGDRGGDEVEAFLDQAGAGFRQGLEDDLNISAALAALFNLVREVNRVLDRDGLGGAAATAVLDRFRRFDRVLAVLDVDREEAVPAPVLAMAEERQAARKARDFQRADVLRDALRDQGWVVEDTPSGPRVKRL
jgi:cysteinyl-tRNA synthetase